MTAVKASIRSDQSTTISPERIQGRTLTTWAERYPVMNPRKIGQLKAAEANSAPVVMSLAGMLPSRRLPRPATRAARSGRKTMSWTFISALHLVDIVDRDRAASTEIDDQDGEADSRLARRDGQDEHGENLPDHV